MRNRLFFFVGFDLLKVETKGHAMKTSVPSTSISPYGPRPPSEWQAALLNQVAYVKTVKENGKPAFSVHAADGTQLAIISDRDTAFCAVKSHDLEPVSCH